MIVFLLKDLNNNCKPLEHSMLGGGGVGGGDCWGLFLLLQHAVCYQYYINIMSHTL